jgi:hypothetical protein
MASTCPLPGSVSNHELSHSITRQFNLFLKWVCGHILLIYEFKVAGWKDVNWNYMAQNWAKLQDLANTVLQQQGP